MHVCPECKSKRLWKDGLRQTGNGPVQRWLCRDCGLRFSESTLQGQVKLDVALKRGKLDSCADLTEGSVRKADPAFEEGLNDLPFSFSEDVGSHTASNTKMGKPLYKICSYGRRCQGSDEKRAYVSLAETKNLAEVSRTEKRAAGATENADVKGKIVEFLWWMKKQGYKQSTIVSRGSRLRRLVKLGADLLNPESVKEVIATQDNWRESRKESMVYTYDLWAKWLGIKWERPVYKAPRRLPFIPLEREIDDLIAGCNKHIATFLQIAKETGARAGEVFAIKWTEVDFETRTLRITAEKGSDPRIFKISTRLAAMLNQLPKESERIFSRYKNLQNLRRSFDRYRMRAARKLGNPRLLQVHFHTLRHWKGTMEYHKTKDILHVMQVL